MSTPGESHDPEPLARIIEQLLEKWRRQRGAQDGDGAHTEIPPPGRDDLAPCDVCRGMRYVRCDVSDYADPRFGTPMLCPACGEEYVRLRRAEAAQRRVARLREMSRAEWPEDKTFESFHPHPAQFNALEKALSFAAEPGGLFTLLGPTGTGKTHLAAAIAARVAAERADAIFLTAMSMMDLIHAQFRARDGDGFDGGDDVVQTFTVAPLLVIDEYGREGASAYARDKLFNIINQRYALGRATVIVSNLSLREIHARDGGLYSRVVDTQSGRAAAVVLDGPDHRLDASGVEEVRYRPGRLPTYYHWTGAGFIAVCTCCGCAPHSRGCPMREQ